jgi:hypothetical protein
MSRHRSASFARRFWTAFTRRGNWSGLDTTDPFRAMSKNLTPRASYDNLSNQHRTDHGASSHNFPGPGGEY